MAQQTQIATMLPYFLRWMLRFPDVASLAEAEEQEVLAHWQGLGYYRRCRMLHAGARQVAAEGLPTTEAEWRRVAGVGAYTAAAIASITVSEPAAVVDGNVERVFARFCGCDAAGSDLHREAWRWARTVIDQDRPGDWNQALMELGALVCLPRSPACDRCPLAKNCVARRESLQDSLPRRKEKPQPLQRSARVWVPVCDGLVGIEQIPLGSWSEGLWDFPRASTEEELRARLRPTTVEPIGEHRHTVTRHRITLTVSRAQLDRPDPNLRWLAPEETASVPMPSPARAVLKLALRVPAR